MKSTVRGRRRLPAVAAASLSLGTLAALLASGPRGVAAAGSTWAQLTPAVAPAPRAGAAVAYDPVRHLTVLFGGAQQTGLLDDTWEWNGTVWARRGLAVAPSPRRGAAMAFDSVRGRLVLYGGDEFGAVDRDTWAYDGTGWAQLCSRCDPGGRGFAGIAGDSERGRVVLFGGQGTPTCVDEDSANDSDCKLPPSQLLNDTWEWDGTSWHRAVAGNGVVGTATTSSCTVGPSSVPAQRYVTAMDYDPARGRTVLFGGSTGGCAYDDTWEYDAAGWHQVRVNGDTNVNPGYRSSEGMAFDAARGRTLLFGGCYGGSALGDTWEWDGAAWTNDTPTITGSPSARSLPAMAYDSGRARTVLFGGAVNGSCVSPQQGTLADTWELRIPAPPSPVSNLAISVDQASIPAGADEVTLGTIPPARLAAIVDSPAVNLLADGRSPVAGSPVGSNPVGSNPVGSNPVGSNPVGSNPVGSNPIDTSPVGSNAISGLGLVPAAVPAGGLTLGSILLSQLPSVDWTSVLGGSALGGLPLQTLTLLQVVTDPVAGPRFAALRIGQVDLGNTLLRGATVAALLLGATPLDREPVPDGYASWCAYLQALGWAPASSCADSPGGSVDLSHNTLLGLEVAGAPIGGAPVGSNPIGSNPVAGVPLTSIPLTAITLDATPLGRIVIGSIAAATRNSAVDCTRVDCGDASTTTLHDAAALSPTAVRSTGRIADLEPAVAGVSIGELVPGLLPVSALPWEHLSVDGMQDVAPVTPAGLAYRIDADVACAGAGQPMVVTATLAKGFRYLPRSSTESLDGGSAQPLSEPAGTPAPLDDVTSTLTWTGLATQPCAGTTAPSQHLTLGFRAQPGLDLGSATASAAILDPGAVGVSGEAPVLVTENLEPTGDLSTAPIIPPDTLVITHVSHPGDVDSFRIPVPATGQGSVVTVTLSHIAIGGDLDLVVTRPGETSVLASPVGSNPVGSGAIADVPQTTNDYRQTLAPETLADLPVGSNPVGSNPVGSNPVGSNPVGSNPVTVSQARGNADETAVVQTTDETGYYGVQVTGYNGSFSNRPYVLHYHVTPPPVLSCAPRVLTGGVAGSLPAAVPPTTATLLVVNEQRIGALYGSAAETSVVGALAALAARPEVNGAVVAVDGDGQTQGDYAAWDRSTCSLTAANTVVRDINGIIARYRTTGLRSVVLVGSDVVVPMTRIPDLLTVGGEQNEARDLAFLLSTSNGTQQADALYAAATLGDYLSDDPYGTSVSIPWQGRELYLPQVATGRLLETPAEITGQIDQYAASNGQLAPRSALVSGYDFLTDGSQLVASNLAGHLGASAVDTSLISDTWARTALLNKLLPLGGAPPDVDSLNGHFNHYLLEPAAANTAGSYATSDLVSTNDVKGATAGSAPAFAGRILFSMGCHAGLNVPDTEAPATADPQKLLDWAQYYGQQRAAVYIGNTGYGYGDTETVGLGERLMSLFAGELGDNRLSVGDKLVMAKHAYYEQMGVYGAYDEKTLNEATFYGLPMYRLTGGSPPPATAPQGTIVTDANGNRVLTFRTTTTAPATAPTQLLTRYDTPRGTYFSGPQAQVVDVQGRAIEPTLTTDVGQPGSVAKGLWLESLATTDLAGITPALAQPTIDLSGREPAATTGDQSWPASAIHLVRDTAFGADVQHAVLIAGQYRGQGVERLVTSLSAEIDSGSPGSDTVPPVISGVSAVRNPDGTITITVGSADNDPSGVRRVAALYLDAAGWHVAPLASLPGTNLFRSSVTPSGTDIDVLAESEDFDGNVGYSTNKGGLFHSVPALAVQPAGTTISAVEGVPTSPLLATFSDPDGSTDPGAYSATVSWGDGSSASGATVTYSADLQRFEVRGTHAFADEGSWTVSVALSDNDGSGGGATDAAQVADAPLSLASVPFTATEGVAFSGPVATLTDADVSAPASDHSAIVTWGDGSSSAATVVARGGGVFDVDATHTYAEETSRALPVGVSVRDDGGQSAAASQAVTVGDAALTASGTTLRGTEDQSFSGVVATFSDANPSAPATDFTARIAWGDCTVTSGTVSRVGGAWQVSGSHTLGEDRGYTVTVDIVDAGGSLARAESGLQVADPSDPVALAADIAEDLLDGGPSCGTGTAAPQ